jgi:hypothetical protein
LQFGFVPRQVKAGRVRASEESMPMIGQVNLRFYNGCSLVINAPSKNKSLWSGSI